MTIAVETQLPNLDVRVSTGLSGTPDSVGYHLEAIEVHNHSPMQGYGNSSGVAATPGNFSRGALAAFQVSAGSGAYGTEHQIHDGSVIESGSATKYFDFNTMFVTAVGTANRATFIEFYYGSRAAGLACTFDHTGELAIRNSHGLSDGNKIMFSTTDTLPAELNAYTTYYVVGKTENNFQVSLTLGGSAVAITDNGTGTHYFHVLTQTLLTEIYISMAATNSDSLPFQLHSPRVLCNNRLWMRAKASGGTNTVDMFFGLHTYAG